MRRHNFCAVRSNTGGAKSPIREPMLGTWNFAMTFFVRIKSSSTSTSYFLRPARPRFRCLLTRKSPLVCFGQFPYPNRSIRCAEGGSKELLCVQISRGSVGNPTSLSGSRHRTDAVPAYLQPESAATKRSVCLAKCVRVGLLRRPFW